MVSNFETTDEYINKFEHNVKNNFAYLYDFFGWNQIWVKLKSHQMILKDIKFGQNQKNIIYEIFKEIQIYN